MDTETLLSKASCELGQVQKRGCPGPQIAHAGEEMSMFGTNKLLGAFCVGQDLMTMAMCSKACPSTPLALGSLAWTCAHDESAWATCYSTRWTILPNALPGIAGDEEQAALSWRDAYGMRAQYHHCSSLTFPCSPTIKDLKDFEGLACRVKASHRLRNLAAAVKQDPAMKLAVTELLSSGVSDSRDMGVYVTNAKEHSAPTEAQSNIPLSSIETKFVLYTKSGQVLQFSSNYFPGYKEMCALIHDGTPPGYELELVGPFGDLVNCDYACTNTMTGSFHRFLEEHEDQERYTVYDKGDIARIIDEDLFEPVALLRVIRCILEPVGKACKRLTKNDIRRHTSGWGETSVCADEIGYHKIQRENKYATAVYNLIRLMAQPGIGPAEAT
jgi:hypothetical protein